MYIYTLYFIVEVGNTLFNTLKFVSEFFKQSFAANEGNLFYYIGSKVVTQWR